MIFEQQYFSFLLFFTTSFSFLFFKLKLKTLLCLIYKISLCDVKKIKKWVFFLFFISYLWNKGGKKLLVNNNVTSIKQYLLSFFFIVHTLLKKFFSFFFCSFFAKEGNQVFCKENHEVIWIKKLAIVYWKLIEINKI